MCPEPFGARPGPSLVSLGATSIFSRAQKSLVLRLTRGGGTLTGLDRSAIGCATLAERSGPVASVASRGSRPGPSRSAKGILCPPAPRQPNTLADGAPQLCCARLPIALLALCGIRDPVAGPLDGSRGRGARLGAPIRKGRASRSGGKLSEL